MTSEISRQSPIRTKSSYTTVARAAVWLLLFAGILLLTGRKDIVSAAASRERNNEPPLSSFDSDDSEMNAAIKKARESVPVFLKYLANPNPDQAYFSIKKPFPTTDGTNEHIWISVRSYDGVRFHGTINNRPVNIAGLKEGDLVAVLTGEISDWMILENGKIVGGYTFRVIWNRMSPAERLEYGAKMEFRD